MRKFFLFYFIFLFSVSTLVFAAGEGTYSNETFGNFSYGISSASSAFFSNSSVGTVANTSTIINATGNSSPNVVLELVTNSDTNGAVTLVKYDSQPPSVSTNTFASPLNKYVDVVVDSSISSQLNYSIIKMYYTDAEVAAANLQESTLRISRWNGTDWVKFEPPTGGVDTENNFVWANTTHFSTWGIFGTSVPAPASGGGGTTSAAGGEASGGSLPGAEEALFQSPKQTPATTPPAPAPNPAPSQPAQAQAAKKPAQNNQQASTGNGITGAATSVPPSNEITGRFIQTIKSPSMVIATIVAALVLIGLFAGRRVLYGRKPKE